MTTISVLLILGMGWQEIMLLILVILLFFGAKRIPELARGLGRGIREFKDASKEIKSELSKGMEEDPSNNTKS
ncbi:MAG TPA: twin-arginine translocase TatA/TatE family subunit [Cytophagaceae bacterium]|jgi:sec-independent protein translocase protein TatA|nr:twin-arginine translocase TatA/TatE family subunit [Cytophagaceae bacterium]